MEPTYVEEEKIFKWRYGLDLFSYAEKKGGEKFMAEQLERYALEERANDAARVAELGPLTAYLVNKVSERIEEALLFGSGPVVNDPSKETPFYYAVMGRIAEGKPAFITKRQARNLKRKLGEARKKILEEELAITFGCTKPSHIKTNK